MTDNWQYWRAALEGHKIDMGPRGTPPCGYYRVPSSKGQELVAIWRTEDGKFHCWRNIFGDGRKMEAEEIAEWIGTSKHYAIPYAVFEAVRNGAEWPDIYRTVLRTKDIAAGVIWSEEWARANLAEQVETHDENGVRREVGLGHNQPPEDLPEDKALTKRIHDLEVTLGAWLKKIGGKVSTQAEAEILGGYANNFKGFENEAIARHKVEKKPHLAAGRAVDEKWFRPVRDKAIESRNKVLTLILAFTDAENARRAEEANKANKAARIAAEEQARRSDEPPPQIEQIVPEVAKVASIRGGGPKPKESLIADLAAFLTYCAKLDPVLPDLVEVAEKIARKFKAAGVKATGMVEGKK